MKSRPFAVAGVLCALSVLLPAQTSVYEIHTSQPAVLAHHLEHQGFDVAGENAAAGTVGVVGDAAVAALLAQAGLNPVLLRGPGAFTDFADGLATPSAEDIPAGYQTPAQISAQLAAFASAHPTICALHNIAAEYGFPGGTYEGRPIWGVKISSNPAANLDLPNVLIVACHHARELNTPEVVLDQISRLVTGYGTNAQITTWVNTHEIWLVPVWNSDGHAYVWSTNANWRKNRKPVGGGAFGVDLNRNYPLGWNGACSGDTLASSDVYRGPSVASEIETQTMVNFAADRRFAKIIDFHSYGRQVLYTYLCSSFPAALETWFLGEATALANTCNYAGATRKPSAEGEHYQFELNRHGTFAFLVEIGTLFQPVYSETTTEKTNTWGGVSWLLAHAIPVRGHTVDSCTGLPVQATRSVNGITYTQGEIRQSEPRFGRYAEFLPPGTWTITYAAAGYVSQVRTVTVTAGVSTTVDVALAPVMSLAAPASASVGSTVTLIASCPIDPGALYLVGVTGAGTVPGFDLAGCHIPLNYDALTDLAVNNQPPFAGFVGSLDAGGSATVMVSVPNDPGIVGFAVDLVLITVPSPNPLLLHVLGTPQHLVVVP